MSSLILASSSAYKKMLLQRLQIPFTCVSPNVDEVQQKGEQAHSMAARLADEKALAIATQYPGAVVIGADQVGELDGTILGKPNNFEAAIKQLRAQSSNTSKFHCGISVMKQLPKGKLFRKTVLNTTEVTFRALEQQQIESYLMADQPYDCAGSFKVEGLGISLFTNIKSNDPSSLVGLPLINLCTLLSEFDIQIP